MIVSKRTFKVNNGRVKLNLYPLFLPFILRKRI